jgi:hypothetical protein
MQNHRKEDSWQGYMKRSGRFYQKEGSKEWYLQTREGLELGPFESHAEAAVCLNDYLDFVSDKNTNEADIQQFLKIYAA